MSLECEQLKIVTKLVMTKYSEVICQKPISIRMAQTHSHIHSLTHTHNPQWIHTQNYH